MIVECDECKKPFDSHDGGYACGICGRVICPKCEFPADYDFKNDEMICSACRLRNGLGIQGTKGDHE